ncbi:MAG: 3-deoxy-7-phosphoheptulonate synthase [Candidatus Kapaibacterium sp.]
MNEEIGNIRTEIDQIDRQIAELLIKRKRLSSDIIKSKIKNSLDLTDQKREKLIITSMKQHTTGLLNPLFIEELYKLIFADSKSMAAGEGTIKEKPVIIAGPCAVEGRESVLSLAGKLSSYGISIFRGGAYKPRTNPMDFQGLGREGIEYLRDACDQNGMLLATEVLTTGQLKEHYGKIDIIQVGSRNMASYGLLKAIGEISAEDGKPVLLKRGFSATINEFLHAAEYIRKEGNPNVWLCLRGIRTFEQIDSDLRNTPDLSAIIELKKKTNMPVFFDPSHASGNSNFVIDYAKAALLLGADGLLIECHENPSDALMDGFQAVTPNKIKELTESLDEIAYAKSILQDH